MTWKKVGRISFPYCCTLLITAGKWEQSSRKWTKCRLVGLQYWVTRSLASGGKFLTLFSVNFINVDLVLSRALHLARMWGRSSEIACRQKAEPLLGKAADQRRAKAVTTFSYY